MKVKKEDGEIWSLKDPEYREMTMIEFYTVYGTGWIADALTGIFRGRIPKETVAGCADDLARVFEKRTGRPQWERVGEIVAENFPTALEPDDGRRDVRLWIYNLVKRYRKRHRDSSVAK